MTKKDSFPPKIGMQNMNAIGTLSLMAAAEYMERLREYVNNTPSPAQLAMTGGEAQMVLDFMDRMKINDISLRGFLNDRVAISKTQNSTAAKLAKQLERHQNMETMNA